MALLDVQHVTKDFGGLRANSDISFSIEKGQLLGLIGPNGAGKTTLFNCISGLHPVSSGQILFEGEDITELKAHEVARRGLERAKTIEAVITLIASGKQHEAGGDLILAAADYQKALQLDAYSQEARIALESVNGRIKEAQFFYCFLEISRNDSRLHLGNEVFLTDLEDSVQFLEGENQASFHRQCPTTLAAAGAPGNNGKTFRVRDGENPGDIPGVAGESHSIGHKDQPGRVFAVGF